MPYFGNLVETGNCVNLVETGNCPSLHDIKLILTHPGEKAIEYWNEIPKHYPFVTLDEFVLMPDHLHGVLFINRIDNSGCQPNIYGIQSRNLAAIIRAYKSSVKRFCNQQNISFEWQAGYYDHIIRNEKDLMNIRQYIIDNPLKWLHPDEFSR